MKLLFKIPDGTDPIVKNSNFKSHFPTVNANMSWQTLTPFIRQAASRYIIPFIGQDIYDDIATMFDDGDALTPMQEKFLELLQDANAWYAIYDMIPVGAITVADAGIGENVGEKQNPARQFAMNKALWKICATADKMMDDVLSLMEKQVQEENAYFDLWKNDPSFSKATSTFFRRTEQFEEVIHIHDSRRTFVALLPNIRRVEKSIVKDLICTPMWDELAEEFAANTLTEENTKLLTLVREVTAHHALAIALPHLSVVVENDGLKVTSTSDSMEQKNNVLSSFGKEAVDRLIQRAQDDARIAEKELIGYLYANAEDYPTWMDSPCYQDPEEEIEEEDPLCITGGIVL